MITYWVEVWEPKEEDSKEMVWRIVPHDRKNKYFEFIGRGTAKKFLDTLRINHPTRKFQMMKQINSSKVTPIKI